MNSEMTDLARALKCGGFGKNGESVTPAEPTQACCPVAAGPASKRSWPSRYASAIPPIPSPTLYRRSRREMKRCWLVPVQSCFFMAVLVDINEFVGVQYDMGEFRQRG